LGGEKDATYDKQFFRLLPWQWLYLAIIALSMTFPLTIRL
jgi:hypothetical protein